MSDSKEIKLISDGNLLFRGSDDKQVRDNLVAPPLVKTIHKQIAAFCNELPSDEFYCLSWRIHKGKL